MTKQHFEIGEQVVHLGTPDGRRKGEVFTVVGITENKKTVSESGVRTPVHLGYYLDHEVEYDHPTTGEPFEQRNILACQTWLAKLPDSQVNGLSFEEMMDNLTNKSDIDLTERA